MANTLIQLEANIKREITKLYKVIHGKGPKETGVKIWGNILIIKLTGSLTPLEDSLRHSAGGEELVHKIRDILIVNENDYYTPLFEEVLETKVMDINYILGKEDSTLYIFSVFKESVVFTSCPPKK